MSGFRKMNPAGRAGGRPARLVPIGKPNRDPLYRYPASQLSVTGLDTPEGSIFSPVISKKEFFDDSFEDVTDSRGDAPAQAIIVRNARTLSQRVADETKEELARVLERVEKIYGRFELNESLDAKNIGGNLEYVNDLVELEDIIHDQVKKKKYQKQVTVFIVGFGNMCSQRLRLLQQVSEFFTESSAMLEEEETAAVSADDIDLEEVAGAVEDSLDTASKLTQRLAEINQEMINYMVNMNQSKTTNKSKKKLERTLEKAKEELNMLNEQLSSLRKELTDKEENIQMMFRQIETKTMEVQRYKTAAEVAKSNANAVETLRDYCMSRDDQIKQLTKELEAVKADKGHAMQSQDEILQELEQAKNASQEKIEELQKTLEQKEAEKDVATEESSSEESESDEEESTDEEESADEDVEDEEDEKSSVSVIEEEPSSEEEEEEVVSSVSEESEETEDTEDEAVSSEADSDTSIPVLHLPSTMFLPLNSSHAHPGYCSPFLATVPYVVPSMT